MSLKFALLGLLNYQSMTGYDLKNIFEESVNHFWIASASQIYRDLGDLEKENYVVSRIEQQEGRPNKKIYTITESGKNAFRDWLNHFPADTNIPIRCDFLVRVFFGAQIPPEELKFQLHKFINDKKQELDHMINHVSSTNEQWRTPPDGKKPVEASERDWFFWNLTVKMGLLSAQAEITWAEEALKEYDVFLKRQSSNES